MTTVKFASKQEGQWTRDTALAMLDRNGQRPVDRTFLIMPGDHIGIGCWGAIDYLCHYHGFTIHKEKSR